jgi:HAD superfamily phosphoserine phosphatase-like hydrolase
VNTLTVSELIARLDLLRAEDAGGAVAFDGDGTLWSGDIGEDFFAAVLARGEVSPEASEALSRVADEHAIDTSGGAVAIARRIHEGYAAGTFPEELACEIMTWIVAGSSVRDAALFADRVLDDVSLEQRLHPEVIAIATWARERGVQTYLVSASPRTVVEQAARRVAIPRENVLAATAETDARGVLLPRVERPIPYGDGKVEHLRSRLAGRALYAAFGDNTFDIPMLRTARLGVAVRPKPRLRARLSEVPSCVLLEPA